ncbi:hypothetical protein WI97_17200 [Burkholderia vietnamiensis]|nr:hypothetical protein WI97_17200 [Burkholderia vietnamiensis]
MTHQCKTSRITRFTPVWESDFLKFRIETECYDFAVGDTLDAVVLIEFPGGLRTKMDAAMPKTIGPDRIEPIVGCGQRHQIVLWAMCAAFILQLTRIGPAFDFG